MKNPFFLRMVVLVATVMCARGVSSAQEAYACHTSEDSTLTFYYDNQRSTRYVGNTVRAVRIPQN